MRKRSGEPSLIAILCHFFSHLAVRCVFSSRDGINQASAVACSTAVSASTVFYFFPPRPGLDPSKEIIIANKFLSPSPLFLFSKFNDGLLAWSADLSADSGILREASIVWTVTLRHHVDLYLCLILFRTSLAKIFFILNYRQWSDPSLTVDRNIIFNVYEFCYEHGICMK